MRNCDYLCAVNHPIGDEVVKFYAVYSNNLYGFMPDIHAVIANAIELLHLCSKPSICNFKNSRLHIHNSTRGTCLNETRYINFHGFIPKTYSFLRLAVECNRRRISINMRLCVTSFVLVSNALHWQFGDHISTIFLCVEHRNSVLNCALAPGHNSNRPEIWLDQNECSWIR